MMSKERRPINVGLGDLLQFRWPIIALASISHRIAGVVLFIGLGIMLLALQVSLDSQAGFDLVQGYIASPLGKLLTWALLAALAYHFVAGVKHLILDGSDLETLGAATLAARVTLIISAILMALAAYWVI
jgi:succinate dehydrogenase / fumarate reductase cytochrome b subunit